MFIVRPGSDTPGECCSSRRGMFIELLSGTTLRARVQFGRKALSSVCQQTQRSFAPQTRAGSRRRAPKRGLTTRRARLTFAWVNSGIRCFPNFDCDAKVGLLNYLWCSFGEACREDTGCQIWKFGSGASSYAIYPGPSETLWACRKICCCFLR